MARHKSPLVIALEYYPARALFSVMRWMPVSWAIGLSNAVLTFLFNFIIPKRLQVIDENLQLCFPEKTQAERDAIRKVSLRGLAKNIAYLPRLAQISKTAAYKEWFIPEGDEHLQKALALGKGVIFMGAHYNFWEAMPGYLTIATRHLSMVARPLDNPRLDRLINSVRECNGATVIPQHQILKRGLRWLREGGAIGILIDQNFYKGGLFVDFFGRPAATTTIITLLARRTGAAVIPVSNRWKGDKLRVICEPPLQLSENPDIEQATAEDTQMMAKIVEGWIRQDPGLWLWVHNRWKRKPVPGDWVYPGGLDVNHVPGVIQGQEE